ncbi:MAG: hypothetical protein LBD11_00485 [Candidatus Peribacteria bacterium]|jgi:hypothetical protein|nr:hypothetical protein [Candidatus Peribacteria bacterium]
MSIKTFAKYLPLAGLLSCSPSPSSNLLVDEYSEDAIGVSYGEPSSKSFLLSKNIQKDDSTFYTFSELLENLSENVVIQRPMSELLGKVQESAKEKERNPLIMGGVKRDM